MKARRRHRPFVFVSALVVLLASVASAAPQRTALAPDEPGPLPERKLWHPLTLSFATAVNTDETAHAPGQNPFLDYRLRVSFRHASGRRTVVDGFYAADGDAAESGATGGNVWQVRFTPGESGDWQWRAEFRQGPSIALNPLATGSVADPAVDGAIGVFRVGAADPDAPGFLGKGRLAYVDAPYLRCANGEWFLKSGAGGPENFLAYDGFDGTTGNPANQCLAGQGFLHRYAAHANDWIGDELDLASDWGGGRAHDILGAIDWLAGAGVNSLYLILDNYQGDGDDVWPWAAPQDKLHFDVSKLEQWERVFAHLNARGLHLEMVLEENENDEISVPDGGLGTGLTNERRLYYRELVTRFGHHLALQWVIGDESDYWDDVGVMKSLASELRALDPYDHPIAFHSKHPCQGPGCTEVYPSLVQQYQPYFGYPAFETSAFQTAPASYNASTLQLRQAQLGTRPWAHFGDEQSLNATPENLVVNRTQALWGNLMGGGSGVAWYPGNDVPSQYPPGTNICMYFDLTVEDFRAFQDYFVQSRHAIELFQSQLPFTQMVSGNALASPAGTSDFVFYRPQGPLGSAVYALYRGTGSATVLTIGPGTHTVEWFDPRTGAGPIADAPVVGPGAVSLVPPTQGLGQDWLAVVRQ